MNTKDKITLALASAILVGGLGYSTIRDNSEELIVGGISVASSAALDELRKPLTNSQYLSVTLSLGDTRYLVTQTERPNGTIEGRRIERGPEEAFVYVQPTEENPRTLTAQQYAAIQSSVNSPRPWCYTKFIEQEDFLGPLHLSSEDIGGLELEIAYTRCARQR